MTLLGCLLLLTGVISCTAAPAPGAPCGVPPRFDDKELQGDWDDESYSAGTQAQYMCRPGFSRLGSIKYVCSEGKWILISTGQCKKKSCGHPGDIDFGTFELTKQEEFVFGAVVEYTCNDGYQMISKQTKRECTATGWSNYRPECEVRYCPPVHVNDNVNLLTTSYEEEFSVGQVIRFECKNSKQKIKGTSEIFCTSQGVWNADPPTCEEIICSPPQIDHGSVKSGKLRFNDQETLEYSCDPGYKTSLTNVIKCTKNNWSPAPLCDEIVCYRASVSNGNVDFRKETYREGETVTLTCNEGFQIENNPEEPRKCTANGWFPPLKCISKKCSEPELVNGYIYRSWQYRFPMSPRGSFYFYCNNDRFLTKSKSYYDTITCTQNGWDRETKCFRKCSPPSQDSINAIIQHTSSQYIQGDKLPFQCYRGHTTPDGKDTGEMTCLPDGSFTGERCDQSCKKPELVNGKSKTDRNVFEVGSYFLYECDEGFISSNNRPEGKSQCGNSGWNPKPECKEITCSVVLNGTDVQKYKSGDVLHFKCQGNGKLEGPSSSQCYYYDFAPVFPVCRDERNQQYSPILDTSPEESLCPPASPPPNAQITNPKDEYVHDDEIEIECDPGYVLYGSEKVLCRDGKWQSPPWCIEKVPCIIPPAIENGEISKESVAEQYYTGSTVRYVCAEGYHMSGSNESRCIDGNWLQPPTCVENSCGIPQPIENGEARESLRFYKHGESAAYRCFLNYKVSGSDPAVCLRGQWTNIPKCVYSSCGQPPSITDGKIKGKSKTTYLSGDKVYYECSPRFTMGQKADFITCEDTTWTEQPQCKRLGAACGTPPVVQFGDTIGTGKQSYPSGSSVRYKCANYYKLEGKETVTCRNGEWEEAPVCRVPCTISESELQQNNIQWKYKGGEDKTKKIYSEHFDNMTFECRQGYQISDVKLLRVQCLDGIVKHPKCLKEGSCTIQQTDLFFNNIRYNGSADIDPGKTVQFECADGMIPEKNLKGRCAGGRIQYPKCRAGQPCRPPSIPNALVSSDKRDSYESGSSVDMQCEETYVLSGHTTITCEKGKWNDLPRCLKPCRIIPTSLDENHIELTQKPSENSPDIPHGTRVNVRCKAGYTHSGSLIASCSDGTMKYPECLFGKPCRRPSIPNALVSPDKRDSYESGSSVDVQCEDTYVLSGHTTITCENGDWNDLPRCLKPCRISPTSLDENHIELRQKSPENPPDIPHGTDVNVKCKASYRRPVSVKASCNDGTMKYSRCFSGETCRIHQQDVDTNNLEMEGDENDVYYEEGETIRVRCKAGYASSTELIGKCTKIKISEPKTFEHKMTYPTCTQESSV